MGGFEFDHLRSPPAGSEKTFTNSSAFSFLLSASKARSWSILSASTFFDSASFARNFPAICCCSVAIGTPVDLSSLSLTARGLLSARSANPLWRLLGFRATFSVASQQYEENLSPKSPLLSWSWASGLDCFCRVSCLELRVISGLMYMKHLCDV